MDTLVAAALLRTIDAVQLLGAQVIIVGITPEVAQSIVHLEVAFGGLTTRPDLQSGLLLALERLGIGQLAPRRFG